MELELELGGLGESIDTILALLRSREFKQTLGLTWMLSEVEDGEFVGLYRYLVSTSFTRNRGYNLRSVISSSIAYSEDNRVSVARSTI